VIPTYCAACKSLINVYNSFALYLFLEFTKDSQILRDRKNILYFAYCEMSNIPTGLKEYIVLCILGLRTGFFGIECISLLDVCYQMLSNILNSQNKF